MRLTLRDPEIETVMKDANQIQDWIFEVKSGKALSVFANDSDMEVVPVGKLCWLLRISKYPLLICNAGRRFQLNQDLAYHGCSSSFCATSNAIDTTDQRNARPKE